MSSFQAVIAERFPGAVSESAFLFRSHGALSSMGFNLHNTLLCVGLCRDELGFSLKRALETRWGEPFVLSSLAGMLFLGRTGFAAAHHHAPVVGGRERLLFVVMPHLGVGVHGELGQCARIGRPGTSVACGALAAFRDELAGGQLELAVDPLDVEQSLLKARLLEVLPFGHVPDLAELARAAHAVVSRDLEALIDGQLDPARTDWGVLTGVHIHGPESADVIWPGQTCAVVGGQRRAIVF